MSTLIKWLARHGAAVVPLLLLWFTAPAASAQDAESLSIPIGSMKVVQVPFVIQGYRVVDPTIAKVEKVDDRQVRIMGVKVGSTSVQLTGDNGASSLYAITVVESAKELLLAMRKDLDNIPEVELTENRNRVVLKGEINSVDHWQLLVRALKAYDEKQYLNLVVFRPAPEMLMRLKDALVKAGSKVAANPEAPAKGEITMKYSGDALLIGGTVYCPAELEKIRSVIAANDWLTFKKSENPADQYKTVAVLNIQMESVMIELDVVYVGVTDNQNDKIGVNLMEQGLVAVGAVAGVVGHGQSSHSGGGYMVGTGLNGVLKAMATNGVKRFKSAGHLTFKSNETPDWQRFHSGGTLKVKLGGQVGGAPADLKDIDYGLSLKVKGGLIDNQTASLQLELELSSPDLMANGDYDLKRNNVTTRIDCGLGKTYVLGGMKDMVQNTTGPTGVPFLRSIPVVDWFFSEKEDKMMNMQVLVLVCPRLAGTETVSLPVGSEETRNTLSEAEKTNQQRMKEANKKKKRWFFFFLF
jgi:type II secretory pathway component GspD/PulD (secretin)